MTSDAATAPAAGRGPLAGLLVADFSRILAGPYARCCSPTSAPRSSRSRARAATTPAPGSRRSATASRPTTWASTATSGRSPWTSRTPATSTLARELARRADVFVENFKPGGLAPVRPGLRRAWRRSTRASSTPRSAASAAGPAVRALPGYDLIVQAISGLHEPHRRRRRRAVPRRGRAVRRHGRPARDDRRARRAQPPARDRARASTSRSTCCPRRCPGWSTRPARSSPAASCRSGWATATRACSRTSRCRAPTAS